MRRRLRHSIGTLLLVGWCLLFLRCETTEKSMVRALYLAQNEATVTVGLLYQAPEASADASEASAAMQMRLAEESTLEKALSSVQKKLPQNDVEDVIQTAFYKLVKADQLLLPQDEMLAWLYHVARNASIDLLKKKKIINALKIT